MTVFWPKKHVFRPIKPSFNGKRCLKLKFLVKTIFLVEKKFFGSKKIFLVETNFLGRKKIFWSKKFWVENVFGKISRVIRNKEWLGQKMGFEVLSLTCSVFRALQDELCLMV